MPHDRLLALFLAFAFSACAAAHTEPEIGSGNLEIITRDQILASRATSAYDVIKKLHANFLSYRGRTSFVDSASSMPQVFMDDQIYGPVSSLKNIPAGQIAQIRLYRAWEAVLKYGSGLPGGAIAIYSRLDQ